MKSHSCCQAKQPYTEKGASFAELTSLNIEGYNPTL